MIGNFFHLVFFLPLYNALIWLSSILPGGDIGLAIVLLTLLVKIILFPLQHRMSKTQAALKSLEPELQRLKEKYVDDKSEQAKQLMALYREHGVNPLSGFIILLIQLPVLLALFWVFKDSFILKPEWFYSFVTPPAVSNTLFLGLLDITTKSYVLAIFVGLSQFFQMKLVLPPQSPATGEKKGKNSLASDFTRGLNLQMQYFMPVMVTFIGFSLPAAISLYWFTSNLFAIGHEIFVNRKLKERQALN